MAGMSPDRFELAMIEHGRRWWAFGGGSRDQIFEEFGLSEEQFFRRLLDLVTNHPVTSLDRRTSDRIRGTCLRRLAPRFR